MTTLLESPTTPVRAAARTSAVRTPVLLRLLVALVVGAAVVLVLAVLHPDPGGTSGPVVVPAPPAVPDAQPVGATAPGGATGAVDGLVGGPSARGERWTERDGVLQRDCSAVHGCGSWYDTSYAPGEAPPMDAIPQQPQPATSRT